MRRTRVAHVGGAAPTPGSAACPSAGSHAVGRARWVRRGARNPSLCDAGHTRRGRAGV